MPCFASFLSDLLILSVEMNEWFDILPHVSDRQVVWFSQCSQLFHAISKRSIQHVQWKRNGFIGCAEHGDVEGVKYLVERCGADVHADGDYPLQLASCNGCLKFVCYLVENGADVHAWNDISLQSASCSGQLEVVKFLIKTRRVAVHVLDEGTLRIASMNGHVEVVKYLKSKGAKQAMQ
jgi:hypothetical protein